MPELSVLAVTIPKEKLLIEKNRKKTKFVAPQRGKLVSKLEKMSEDGCANRRRNGKKKSRNEKG